MAFIRYFANISKLLLASVLAATLICPVLDPGAAWADEVSDAQAALNQAEERMAEIQAEYKEIEEEVADLQDQIDEAKEGVMDAQAEVQEGRERLGEMCSEEYKNGHFSLLTLFFEAQDLGTLLDSLHYMDVMQENESEEIDLQRQREEEFKAAVDDMNAKKDAQMKALAKAEAKSKEAEQVVANASAHLTEAKESAAEAKRLAALQAQAQKMAEEQSTASENAAPPAPAQKEEPKEDANKNDSSDEATRPGGNEGNEAPSSPENVNPEAGWRSGAASAYGSKSDGTLGATTATGAVVTGSSMGVAVPMSWPNYRSYFGRTVEISYGGRTVFAVVNDCGYMGGGSRHLDLQPGVWKALGASSCFDWGVRTVSYRFI